VGDSRVVASIDQGRKIVPLSRDHKPNDKDEQKRILSFGGKIYQSQINAPPGYPGPKVLLGPHRVFPGRLSVSRTFGDFEAKLPKLGGNPYVVVAEPEIKSYKITKDWDFLVLASDGVYDKMENLDVAHSVWGSMAIKETDVHKQSAVAVETLMKESLIQKTMDNITVVMVSFAGFERASFGAESPQEELHSSQLLQKSMLNNSSLNHSDKSAYSPYTPPMTQKNALTSYERQILASSKDKRDTHKGVNHSSYLDSYHIDKQNTSIRRTKN